MYRTDWLETQTIVDVADSSLKFVGQASKLET